MSSIAARIHPQMSKRAKRAREQKEGKKKRKRPILLNSSSIGPFEDNDKLVGTILSGL